MLEYAKRHSMIRQSCNLTFSSSCIECQYVCVVCVVRVVRVVCVCVYVCVCVCVYVCVCTKQCMSYFTHFERRFDFLDLTGEELLESTGLICLRCLCFFLSLGGEPEAYLFFLLSLSGEGLLDAFLERCFTRLFLWKVFTPTGRGSGSQYRGNTQQEVVLSAEVIHNRKWFPYIHTEYDKPEGELPYIWKYWRSLNLATSARSGCNLILAEIKFGSCTTRTKHSK